MMLYLNRWLTPPVFPDDEDKTRRAGVLNIALLASLALMAIVLVGSILGGRTSAFIIGAGAAVILVCLVLLRWMHQGRVRLASTSLIGMSVVCTTMFVGILGTIRVPATAFYLLIVIVGGLLFDASGTVVTTVLSSLAVLGLIVAQNAGLLPRPDYTVTIPQWLTYTALCGFSGGLTFAVFQSTRQALQRADREIAKRERVEAALRESEARYRRLVEGSPDIVYAFSDRRGGLYYSSSAEATLGYSPAHLCAHPFLWNESIHADDRAQATRAIQESASGRTFDIEYRICDAGGKWHWLRDRSIGRRIEDGESFIEGLATDITDRKQAEEALRASEQKFRSFVEQSSEGFTLVDERGVIIEWNRAREQVTGLSRDHVIGRPFWDVQLEMMPSEERSAELYTRRRQTIEEALRTGESYLFGRTLEAHVMRPDGLHRFSQQTVFPIKTDQGYRIGSTSRDVTEQRRAEEALRESEEKFNKAFRFGPLAMTISDSVTRNYLEVNDAFVRLTGYPREELVGHTARDLHLWADLQERERVLQLMAQQGFVRGYEIRHRNRDGEIWVALISLETVELKGAPCLLTTLQDITERGRVEEALRQLNADLEQRVAERTRELTEANARLTDLDRLKDEFISRISHELRTPLANVKLYLELLGRGKPEKYEQYLQTIRAEADKLQQQIDDLLEVSSFQTIRIEPQIIRLDINRLVQDLIADQLEKAQTRGLTLTVVAKTDQPSVASDWALVWQVLSRLMANALAYTPRGGAVTLRTDRRDAGDQAWLTVEIRDTGPGISDKDLQYIFEPFYRGAAASSYKTPGTGVGLSIARRTIEQLGGRITVDSQPGQGSVFTIWLRAE